METVKEKQKLHYGFYIVVCCCIFSFTSVALLFGCAGIFYTPVSEALGVSRGTFAFYATVMSLASSVSMMFVSKLIERYKLKHILIADLVLQALCFALQALFTKVYLFYLTAVILGFVSAFTTSTLNTVVLNRWFRKKVGFFIGFASSMTGVSGIIINPLAGNFMAHFGWEKTYLLYAGIVAFIALPFAIFVFKDDPLDVGLRPYGIEEAEREAAEGKADAAEATGVPVEKAVRSSAFIYIVLSLMTIGSASGFVPFLPSYASSLGASLTFAATLAGISQIGTLVGKNTLGAVSDRNTPLAVTIGAGISVAGLLLMLFFGSSSTFMMQAGAAMFGIIYASATVLNPLVVIDAFGIREYTKIQARISLINGVINAAMQSLWGFIADLNDGDFTMSMFICVAFCVIGCVSAIIGIQKGKKLERV